MRRLRLRQTSLTFVLCLAILSGIGLAHSRHGSSPAVCEVTAFLVVMFWRWRSPLTLLAVVLLGLNLGLWRGAAYMQKLAEYKPYLDHKIFLQVRALDDAVYDKHSQL